jgi:hypothetical protein
MDDDGDSGSAPHELGRRGPVENTEQVAAHIKNTTASTHASRRWRPETLERLLGKAAARIRQAAEGLTPGLRPQQIEESMTTNPRAAIS